MKRVARLVLAALVATAWGCQEQSDPLGVRDLSLTGKGGGGGGGKAEVSLTVLVSSFAGADRFGASGINDAGEVVGSGTPEIGFHWADGTISALGALPADVAMTGRIAATLGKYDWQPLVLDPGPGGTWVSEPLPANNYAVVTAISDDGDLVVGGMQEGEVSGIDLAVLWTRDGAGWTMTTLDSPLGGIAHDVNDDGLVVGVVGTHTGNDFHAVVWSNGGTTMQTLPPAVAGADCFAYAVNRYGDVTGTSGAADGAMHVVVWHRSGNGWSSPEIIPDPKGGSGWTSIGSTDISDTGQVVLNQNTGSGSRAFVWDPVGRKLIALKGSGAGYGQASAINERNQIVGESGGAAVMWTLP